MRSNDTMQTFALSFFQHKGTQPTTKELQQFWVEGHKKIEELQAIIKKGNTVISKVKKGE